MTFWFTFTSILHTCRFIYYNTQNTLINAIATTIIIAIYIITSITVCGVTTVNIIYYVLSMWHICSLQTSRTFIDTIKYVSLLTKWGKQTSITLLIATIDTTCIIITISVNITCYISCSFFINVISIRSFARVYTYLSHIVYIIISTISVAFIVCTINAAVIVISLLCIRH